MTANCGCKNTSNNCNTCNNQTTGGFAFILVLFILIVLVGAAWVY